MSGLSGKVGEIDIGSSTLLDFTNGNLEYGAEPQEYFARSGGGAAETVDGAESGSGSFELVFNDANLFDTLVSTGDLVDMIFRHNTTGSVEANGKARIGNINRQMNRDGSVQRLTVNYVTHGSWTFPS